MLLEVNNFLKNFFIYEKKLLFLSHRIHAIQFYLCYNTSYVITRHYATPHLCNTVFNFVMHLKSCSIKCWNEIRNILNNIIVVSEALNNIFISHQSVRSNSKVLLSMFRFFCLNIQFGDNVGY